MTLNKWTIEKLMLFIETEEEGTRVEYKRSEKLAKDKKNDICKIVSAFANSDGGVLIFGVDANNGSRSFDTGVNISAWKQENGAEPELWLRQILESSIRRPIPGIDIECIDNPVNSQNKIILLKIPQSIYAPHQLLVDKERREFHKRDGSRCRQMEEYEIRDVMNRQQSPDLWINFYTQPNQTELLKSFAFLIYMPIHNKSIKPAENFIIDIWIDKKLSSFNEFSNIEKQETVFTVGDLRIPAYQYTLPCIPRIPLYGDTLLHVFNHYGRVVNGANCPGNDWMELGFQGDNMQERLDLHIKWQIQAPFMVPRYGIEQVILNRADLRLIHSTVESGLVID